MNKSVLIGRLTADPTMRYTPQGTPVTTFTLAVNRRQKDKADFINIKAWNKTAELCAQYLGKGRKVCVVGRLEINVSEKDGQRKYFTEVVADEVEFLDSKQDADDKPTEEYTDTEDVPF